jgi:hypothetical protein
MISMSPVDATIACDHLYLPDVPGWRGMRCSATSDTTLTFRCDRGHEVTTPRCPVDTRTGARCALAVVAGSETCHVHRRSS